MYYLNNNAPSPALNRFSMILKDYQGSNIIPQTLYRMYEAFEMLKLKDKSNQTYLILKYNFPKSKWTKEITNKKNNMIQEPGYLKNNFPSPAITRFSIIIKDYQGSSIMPQTLYRMYEAFEMLKLKDKSEQTYLILKYNFPKSKWTEEIFNKKSNTIEEPSYFKNIMNKMISIF